MKKLLLFGALAFGLNAFGQVPSYVPTNGLVGWWGFNGNANDESGNGNNGNLTGCTQTAGHLGDPNSAYLFNGSSDLISVPNDASLQFQNNNLSISFWISISALPNPINEEALFYKMEQNLAIDNTGESAQGFKISFNSSGNLFFNIKSGTPGWGSVQIPGSSIILNDFNHIVFVNNGTELVSYLNGVQINSSMIPANISIGANTSNFLIGKSNWISLGQPMDFFNGKFDNIGLWERALNVCEIQDLYYTQLNNLNNTVTQNGAQLTADETGVAYQWLDCDNNYAVINSETNQSYTPAVTGNYAVEVNMNGCIDTSACFLVDYTGIEELLQNEKELVKIIDFMGRETEYKPNTPLIFIYSDGSRERVMKIEE